MADRMTHLLLAALFLWTALGGAGVLLAHLRHEPQRRRAGLRALAVTWGIYLLALLTLSLTSHPTRYQPGQQRCFSAVCFAVTNAEQLQGFWARGQERERLIRVTIRVTNPDHAHTNRETGLSAYLVDAQGRRWEQLPGLSGVPLTTALPPSAALLSQPIFRVAKDATALHLVLFHPAWTVARITLADPESYLHPPAEMLLPSATAASN